MSTASSNTPTLSEELRYELAESSRLSEHRNQPKGWLVLATLLFLVAGIALMVTLSKREHALKEYRKQIDRLAKVENVKPQFDVIARQQQAGLPDAYAPIPNILTRIELAATTARLNDALPPPTPTSKTAASGAIERQYKYVVNDPSLEHLLDWIDRAQESVPGLKVSALQLTPQANTWKIEVTFVRWERGS